MTGASVVSIEEISELERRLVVRVPRASVQTAVQAKLEAMSRSPKIKLDGFRAGKVPRSLIEKRYGLQVREEMIQEVVRSSLFRILEANKFRAADEHIRLEEIKAEDGDDLHYTVFFELLPEVLLKPFSDLAVNRYQVEVLVEDVEEAIADQRQDRR